MHWNMILACDPNGYIGKENKLPWPYHKEDMEWFKMHTKNNIIVMGYNTWKSLPFKLPHRVNIVISNSNDGLSKDGELPDHVILRKNDSIHAIVNELSEIHQQYSNKSLFLIGGKKTYEMLLPFIHRIYLTVFDECYGGDTKMRMNYYLNDFSRISNTSVNGASFKVYYRRKDAL